MEVSLQNILPVSDFRKDSGNILKKLKHDHDPIILTQRGRSVAVLMDVRAYQDYGYEAAFRSAVQRGLKDLEDGRTVPSEKVFRDVRERIRKRAA